MYVYRGNTKNDTTPMKFRRSKDGRNRKVVTECGTYRGYRFHLENNEDPCHDCRVASSESCGHEGRLKMRAGEAECGTEPGYKRHRYLKEETCTECRTAHSRYVTEQRAKAKDK